MMCEMLWDIAVKNYKKKHHYLTKHQYILQRVLNFTKQGSCQHNCSLSCLDGVWLGPRIYIIIYWQHNITGVSYHSSSHNNIWNISNTLINKFSILNEEAFYVRNKIELNSGLGLGPTAQYILPQHNNWSIIQGYVSITTS